MGKQILIVVTSCDQLGNTGNKTGWYLPEVAHPYHEFTKAGHSVTFVSPKGGKAPMDPGSGEQFKDDEICKQFLANASAVNAVENTKTPSQVEASDFACIFYAGGHGPMWDCADNKELHELCKKIYGSGGVASAVCHGTVGLLNVKLSDGKYLIEGKKVTSFTNDEENAVGLMEVMPFPLETKLKENGADFQKADNWACNVAVSGKVITGQNPASASETAKQILKALG